METNTLLFSIIVPVYNAEKFVGDTINNLLKQNVSKEILLINDGSLDNSLELLRKYETEYSCIKVIDKTNGGVSSARNVGINFASGEFILFVDSDDFIETGILERCSSLLLEYDIDGLFFSYKYCYPNTNRKDFPVHYISSGVYPTIKWIEDFYKLSSTNIINCIGTTIYRRNILSRYKIRFNENISYYEDISFCTEYLGHIRMLYYIDESVYQYRFINPFSLITKYRQNFVQSMDYLHKRQMEMFTNIYGQDVNFKKELYQVFANHILDCLSNLFNYAKESADVIDKDLDYLSNLPYLELCISSTRRFKKRFLLLILKKMNNRQKIVFFTMCFKTAKQLRKIKRCIKI